MNILAIGSHPDDIELGAGGFLIKAVKNGHNVFMYVLTRGDKSGDPKQRTNEVLESAKYIGAKAVWIDNFEDTRLAVDSKLINHIEYFINKADPHVILTHSPNDYHHDHRSVSTCTLEAARNSQNVLAYEVPLTKQFSPHIYHDITEVIDAKVRLIDIFFSQRNKGFAKSHAIKVMAESRALQSRLTTRLTHVEAFEVLKMCVDMDFKPIKFEPDGMVKAVREDVSPDLVDIIEYRAMDTFLDEQLTGTDIKNSVYNIIKEPAEKAQRKDIL